MARKKSDQPASEADPSQDPLTENRRELAADSLANFLLDLDAKIDSGKSATPDEIALVVLRKILQLLADPCLPEASQLKALEHLTNLRKSKLVQPTQQEHGDQGDGAPARPELLEGSLPRDV